MKTIQKMRWLFGFLSAILFVFLSLGWFLHHEIMEKISHEAKFYGFETIKYEKVVPIQFGFSLKNIVLKGQDRFITLDALDITFSWESLFYQTFDQINLKGLRFDESLERLQSFLHMCFFKINEKNFCSHLNVEGMGLARQGDKAYLLPLQLTYDGEDYKKRATLELRPLGDQISGLVSIYLERNGQDLKIQSQAHNLILNDIRIKDCEFIFQSDPYQADAIQKYNLSMLISDAGISALYDNSKNMIPFDMNVNLQFIVGGHQGTQIQGDGIGSVLGHDMKISAVTKDQKIKLLLETNEDESDSLKSALSSVTAERVKTISGNMKLKGNLEIPIQSLEGEIKDPLALLFMDVVNLFMNPEKKADIHIDFDKFTIEAENYSIKSVSGGIFGEFFPFKTRGNQKISCEELVFAPQSPVLKNIEVLFAYDEKPQLKELKASIFDGDLHLHSFQGKPNGSYRLLFEMKNMGMSQAFQLLDMPNLSGSGLIQGKGQVEYSEEFGLSIINARFTSQDKSGRLSYKDGDDEMLAPDMKEVKAKINVNEDLESQALAFQILRDLYYTHFSLDIVPEKGTPQAFLEIMGYNPEVLSGHPFHFKIKLGGNLDEIVKKSVSRLRVSSLWAGADKKQA